MEQKYVRIAPKNTMGIKIQSIAMNVGYWALVIDMSEEETLDE